MYSYSKVVKEQPNCCFRLFLAHSSNKDAFKTHKGSTATVPQHNAVLPLLLIQSLSHPAVRNLSQILTWNRNREEQSHSQILTWNRTREEQSHSQILTWNGTREEQSHSQILTWNGTREEQSHSQILTWNGTREEHNAVLLIQSLSHPAVREVIPRSQHGIGTVEMQCGYPSETVLCVCARSRAM